MVREQRRLRSAAAAGEIGDNPALGGHVAAGPEHLAAGGAGWCARRPGNLLRPHVILSPSPVPIRIQHDYAELPASAADLFADPDGGDLFHSRQWLKQAQASGLRHGDRLELLTLEGAEGPRALLPALYSRLYGPHPGARVLHFLQPDEQPYEPIIGALGIEAAALAAELAAFFGGAPKAFDVVRASPLDQQSRFTAALVEALRKTGHLLQVYRQPDDHFEDVSGLGFDGYMAARPRPLRESLERYTRLLLQGGRARFYLAMSVGQFADAWGAVRRVIAATPQQGQPEPLQHLQGIMRVAAELGGLRLGLLFLDDQPVNVQFWVVTRGVARCLRFWSGTEQRAFPLDDMLTQFMALYLIDADHVSELDFGSVRADFAADWAPAARQRIGVVAFNRRTWRGLRGAARHIGVGLVKSLPKRLWRVLGGGARA